MDPAQARDILGLGSAHLTASSIREARNGALKAHHPDLAGSDEATKRRATYWASQINAAYEVLTDELHGHAGPSLSEPPRQSFAAAARRAEARVDRDREAEHQRAAAEETAASAERAATERAALERRAAAAERAAAELRATERATAETASAAAPPRAGSIAAAPPMRRAGRSLRIRRGTVIAVAAILIIGSTVGTVAALARLNGASPAAARVEASATPSPVPTASPTPAPTPRAASLSFDYWAAMYARSILPCHDGGTCALDAVVEYSDGTTAKFGPEVERLAALYRDTSKLSLGNVEMCRPEVASSYALFASLSSEVDVLGQLRKGERTSDAWRPGQVVSFEGCNRPMNRATAEDDLGKLLTQAHDQVLRAQRDVAGKDWHDARLVGDQLATLGIPIARLAVRDDPGLAVPTWGADRALGWDLLRVSGALGVERLAASSATTTLLMHCLDEIDASPVRPV